jgi:hypothetical protein
MIEVRIDSLLGLLLLAMAIYGLGQVGRLLWGIVVVMTLLVACACIDAATLALGFIGLAGSWLMNRVWGVQCQKRL